MARISNQEKLRKQQDLNRIVLDLFLSEGVHAVTYNEVAKRYNTTKSAIQRYYPSHSDFVNVLESALLPFVIDTLSWKSELSFIESWKRAIYSDKCSKFRKAIEFLLADAAGSKTSEVTLVTVEKLRMLVDEKFNNESILFDLIGESFSAIVARRSAHGSVY
mgnify:CR=1 FL=1